MRILNIGVDELAAYFDNDQGANKK
jgi:hypothetical protein